MIKLNMTKVSQIMYQSSPDSPLDLRFVLHERANTETSNGAEHKKLVLQRVLDIPESVVE